MNAQSPRTFRHGATMEAKMSAELVCHTCRKVVTTPHPIADMRGLVAYMGEGHCEHCGATEMLFKGIDPNGFRGEHERPSSLLDRRPVVSSGVVKFRRRPLFN